MASKYQSLVAFFIILIFSLLVWWPSRYLPYFWDGSGYLINTATDFFNQTTPFLISQHTDFAHPPLFPLLLSINWHLFGNNQLVSHLTMLPFLPLLLFSTYMLIKKFLPTSFAIFGTALIALFPTIMAEYINVYVDLPSAALITAGVCALIYQRHLVSVLLLTLALLIKIPVLTLLPIYYLLLPKKSKLLLLIPLSVLAAWLIYHYQLTGWFWSSPTRSITYASSLTQLLSSTLTFLIEFFWTQGKFLWLLIFASGLIFLKFRRLSLDSKHLPYLKAFALGIITTAIFFIFTAEIAPRYLLYVTPIYAFFVSYSLYYLLPHLPKNILLQLLIFTLPAILLVYYWRPSTKPTTVYDFLAPYNLHVYDYIHTFRQLAATIELTAPKAEIYGAFPESQMLTQSYQGYVSTPLNFYPCDQFSLNPEVLQLIVAHPYSPPQLNCAKLINLVSVTPQARFETNGIWAELYQVNASASATK